MKTSVSKINLHTSEYDECSRFILQAFESKKKINSKYSIRAFAKFLEIDHSLLAKFLRGESILSSKTISGCLQKLKAPSSLIERSGKKSQRSLHFSKIADDEFEYISKWTHFAILELMTIPHFELTPENIRKKINLSLAEARECIQRLEKLGFIEKKRNKYILRQETTTWYPQDQTNAAKIKFQKNILEISRLSLENDLLEERDHSSVILAINKSELPMIKEVIRDARRKLTKIMQKNKDFDDVYCLQMSFYPLRERK